MNNTIEDNDVCYICGHGNPDTLEEHHIIPRRYDGSDASRNLVDLCPSCHSTLERIYDDAFFGELGVTKTNQSQYNIQCEWGTCTSTDTHKIESSSHSKFVCDGHRRCGRGNCDDIGTPVSVHQEGLTVLCDEHRICNHADCYSTDVVAYNTSYSTGFAYCPEHAAESMFVRESLEIDDSKRRIDLFRDIRATVRELQGEDADSGAEKDAVIDVLREEYAPPAIEEQLSEMRSVGELYRVKFTPEEVRLE